MIKSVGAKTLESPDVSGPLSKAGASSRTPHAGVREALGNN